MNTFLMHIPFHHFGSNILSQMQASVVVFPNTFQFDAVKNDTHHNREEKKTFIEHKL